MSTRITYIGHSTVHLDSGNASLITDPVFSRKILCLRRQNDLGMSPGDVPEPQAILISHAHYDHLDIHSFKYFSSRVPVIVPEGLGSFVSRFVRNPVIELLHGSSHRISERLDVHAFPVAHVGFRLSGLRFRTCNGYLITLDGSKIFFPGDTGWRDDFAAYKGVDAALLPLGPTKPEWLMRQRHLTPDEVIRLSELLEARVTIPIHWGAFRLSPEPLNENIEELRSHISLRNLEDKVRILKPSECVDVCGGSA